MTRRRNGFTLVEMLIVISVIALLIAIVVPSFQHVRVSAANQRCLTNLHHLGNAWTHRRTDYNGKVAQGPLAPEAWQYQLGVYFGESTETLYCALDSGERKGPAIDPLVSIAQMGILVHPGGGNTYVIPLKEGPLCRVESLGAGKMKFWFEDIWGGGDQDYGDIQLVAEFLGDGKVHISYDGTDGAGYEHDLVGPNDEVYWTGIKHMKIGEGETFGLGGEATGSYALNAHTIKLKSGSEKILFLDYPKTVAKVGMIDVVSDEWYADEGFVIPDTEFLTFQRHRGAINAITADGAAKPYGPLDIYGDIVADEKLMDKYWRP